MLRLCLVDGCHRWRDPCSPLRQLPSSSTPKNHSVLLAFSLVWLPPCTVYQSLLSEDRRTAAAHVPRQSSVLVSSPYARRLPGPSMRCLVSKLTLSASASAKSSHAPMDAETLRAWTSIAFCNLTNLDTFAPITLARFYQVNPPVLHICSFNSPRLAARKIWSTHPRSLSRQRAKWRLQPVLPQQCIHDLDSSQPY